MKPTEPLNQPIATTHSKRRFRERTGLPARAVERAARLALLHGHRADSPDCPGPIRSRLKEMARRHETDNPNGVYVSHKNVGYIFSSMNTLITVIPDIAGLTRLNTNEGGHHTHPQKALRLKTAGRARDKGYRP